jgi:hypothetical protein
VLLTVQEGFDCKHMSLKSWSISVLGTTEEWDFVSLYLKWVLWSKRSCAIIAKNPRDKILLWWNHETCWPLEHMHGEAQCLRRQVLNVSNNCVIILPKLLIVMPLQYVLTSVIYIYMML